MTPISEIRSTPLRRTLAGPYGMALGLAATCQCTCVKLEAEDGTARIGEAWGPPAVVRAYSKAVLGGIRRY